MNTHIVRMKDNKEIVGIFTSRDRGDLWFLVDQVCDPIECELAALPAGGIMWTDADACKIVESEYADPGDDWDPQLFKGVSLDECWLNAIFFRKLRWKQFEEADRDKYFAGIQAAIRKRAKAKRKRAKANG